MTEVEGKEKQSEMKRGKEERGQFRLQQASRRT